MSINTEWVRRESGHENHAAAATLTGLRMSRRGTDPDLIILEMRMGDGEEKVKVCDGCLRSGVAGSCELEAEVAQLDSREA